MRSEIHPLVMATIENERARRELELERLRSAREACVTSSVGGQNRALSLGKRIRQLEEITGSWRLVLATVLGAMDEMTQAAEGATDAFQELSAALAEDARLVAYRSKINGLLFCREHGEGTRFTEGLSSEDLPNGGLCSQCGGDVLA